MVGKLIRLIKNPMKYGMRAGKMALWRMSGMFGNRSFYLQSQMDIAESSLWFTPHFIEKTGGFYPLDDIQKRRILWMQPWDNVRRDMLILLVRSILERNIEGAFAELGVYRGETARLLHHYCPERRLFLFDTFSGFGERSVKAEFARTGLDLSENQFSDTSVEIVCKFISPENENVEFIAGFFPDSVPQYLHSEMFAFVHLDADLYDPIFAGLNWFYKRVIKGGVMIVHDYNAWPGARAAVNDFFIDKPEVVIPMPDKSGSALIVKG